MINIQEFCKTLELENKLYYDKYKNPEQYNLKFDNYLSDNKEINNILSQIIKRNGEQTYLYAPTGSGKTYTLIKDVFENTQETDVNFLFVPTYSQAKQIEQEYNIPAIVGGKDNHSRIDYYIIENNQLIINQHNYVVVYDKAVDVLTFIKDLKEFDNNLIPHIIIDEAHSLSTARFRDNALKYLRKLITTVLGKNGSVIYTTASYMNMTWTQFDNLVFCTPRNEIQNFKELKIYINKNPKLSLQQFLKNVVRTEGSGLIRLNDKIMQEGIKTNLEKLQYKVEKLNGEEKGYEITEDDKIIYNNDVLEAVVNNSVLPDIDYTICTSLLDAGQNVKGIGSIDNQPKDFNAYYVINNFMNLNIPNLQQFSNRIRFQYNKFGIVYYNQDVEDVPEKEFKGKEQIIKNVVFRFKEQLRALNAIKDILEHTKTTETEFLTIEEVEENIRSILNNVNHKNGHDNSFGGAISYENGKFIISYAYLHQYIEDIYHFKLTQYFPQFIKVLEDIFGMKVSICELYFEEKEENDIEKLTKEKLLKIRENKKFINNYYESEYKTIREQTLFQNCLDFVKLGLTIEDAIEKVCTLNKCQLNNLRSRLIREKIEKYLNEYTKKMLCDIITNKKSMTEIKDPELYDTFDRILKNLKHIPKLKQGMLIGMNIDELLKIYENAKTNKEVSNYVYDYQVKKMNENYLINPKLLNVPSAKVQRRIIDYVVKLGFKLNEKNRFEISKKRMDELLQILKDEEKIEYKQKELEQELKFIFKTWTVKKKLQTILQLIELNI